MIRRIFSRNNIISRNHWVKRYSRLSYTTMTSVKRPKVLITGSLGQIGTELVRELRGRYGSENVIATDIRKPTPQIRNEGPFKHLNVEDATSLERLIVENDVNWLIHLGAILSAAGEKDVEKSFGILMRATENVCNLSTKHGLRLFVPSSIAAFGPTSPLDFTPDLTIQRPRTIYGVGKVYLELLGEYFAHVRGLDFRSLRFPGILSYKTPPGGGTTDYAVEIFHEAISRGEYSCFLSRDSVLPMMYMPDCLNSIINFLETPNEKLTLRTYNVAAISFSPEELANEIKKFRPDFKMKYQPDFRDQIAKSWPKVLDDGTARRDWNWNHRYNLTQLTKDMWENISLIKSNPKK